MVTIIIIIHAKFCIECNVLQLKEMKANYVDYCSFEALITGVNFYAAKLEIKPMLRVLLVRDHGNGYDDNAVMAKVLDSAKVISHLDKKLLLLLPRLYTTIQLV